MQTRGGKIGDTGEDVGEPGLGIDVVETASRDRRQHDGGPVGSALRAGEGPIAPPKATPRSALSAALLTGMMPATRLFRLAFMARGSHESTTGIGASGARNGGRPSFA